MRIATWNVRPLYTAGAMNGLVKETDKYKSDICVLQETGRPGTGNVIKKRII
jgi:exonuclease III